MPASGQMAWLFEGLLVDLGSLVGQVGVGRVGDQVEVGQGGNQVGV